MGLNRKRLPRRRRRSSKRLAFLTAPRNDGTRSVVIARRLLNDKVKKNVFSPWQSVQWENGTLTGRDCHVAEENHLKRLAFFPAPRNDAIRGVVIARRLLNDKVKKNVFCAVAICSIGEWDLNGTDCHVAEEDHLNDWHFFRLLAMTCWMVPVWNVSSLRGA